MFSPIFIARKSCPWFLGLRRTQVGNLLESIVFWIICWWTFSQVWREARSYGSYRNFIFLFPWRWWLVGHPFPQQGLPHFLKCLLWWCWVPRQAISSHNNIWVQPAYAKKLSVAEHKDSLIHFIQDWAFTHSVLCWSLFIVVNCIFHCWRYIE